MENKRLPRYSRLSNLQEIEKEKQKLRQLIGEQQSNVKKDWDTVYEFWSFVPHTARVVRKVAKELPQYFSFAKGITTILKSFHRAKE